MFAGIIATKAAAAAQWLWNAAMSANPIGLIILAIAALVVGIILMIKHWDKVKEVFGKVWDWIMDKFKAVVNFFESIPSKIGAAFSTLKDIMLAPFRSALRGIEMAINWLIRQINKIHITIPSWVPGIGGKGFGFDIPEISLPSFQKGGLITEPTLLYGLRSKRPYAIAGEAGIETVTSGEAGINNYFNISSLVVREEADIRYIARELYRLQLSRSRAGG